MSSRSALRQLRRLERVFAVVEPEDDWIDVLMWNGVSGGLFGHVHRHLCGSQGDSKPSPCSDEEEVEIMRQHYENDKHRCRGKEVPFWKYLETFSYLAPDGLVERQRTVIDRLRGEENGARLADTDH